MAPARGRPDRTSRAGLHRRRRVDRHERHSSQGRDHRKADGDRRGQHREPSDSRRRHRRWLACCCDSQARDGGRSGNRRNAIFYPGSAGLKTQTNRVVCVCGGFGFPLGSASSARIVMIGRTLLSAGVQFHVLHCGPTPVAVNTQRSGVYQGISFEYTTVLKRPENRLLRLLVYALAVTTLTFRLMQMWPERKRTLVHLYVMMGPLNFYIGWLCRILGIPVAQELCEWWPGVDVCDRFTHWLHKRSMFERATGVLVISKEIDRRVMTKKLEVNRSLVVHRLPAIVDFERFATAPASEPATFTYCGTWLNDICFCIEALGIVQRAGHPCRLTIVGAGAEYRDEIFKFAAEKGVPA